MPVTVVRPAVARLGASVRRLRQGCDRVPFDWRPDRAHTQGMISTKRLFLAVALSVCAAGPAGAQSGLYPLPSDPGGITANKGDRADRLDRPRAPSADERRASRLDRMFDELARATTKERADRIAGHILRRMTASGSDTVDLLMNRAAVAMRRKDYGLALDLLDGVVRLKPDFAEGWNRRATVNFLAGDYGRSIADIEQTLKLEPRHWGALVGLSVIMVSMDQKAAAVDVMTRALEIHPFLEDTRDRRDRFKLEVDGSAA